MNIDVKEKKQNKNKLFLIIIIIAVLTAIYTYNYYNKPKPQEEVLEEQKPQQEQPQIEEEPVEEGPQYEEILTIIEGQQAYICVPTKIDENNPPVLVIYSHGSNTSVTDNMNDPFMSSKLVLNLQSAEEMVKKAKIEGRGKTKLLPTTNKGKDLGDQNTCGK